MYTHQTCILKVVHDWHDWPLLHQWEFVEGALQHFNMQAGQTNLFNFNTDEKDQSVQQSHGIPLSISIFIRQPLRLVCLLFPQLVMHIHCNCAVICTSYYVCKTPQVMYISSTDRMYTVHVIKTSL